MKPYIPRSLVRASLLLMMATASFAAEDDSERFRLIYEKEWAFRTSEFPSLAVNSGVEGFEGKLAHVSEQDQRRRHDFWKGIRAELTGISCARLGRNDCINLRIFTRQMDNFIAGYETKSYLVPFNSDWAFYMGWTRLPSETRFTAIEDYRNYLSKLHQVPVVMDEYIGLMRTGLELGITQPGAVLDGRDAPIKAQLVENVRDSVFWAPFADIPESLASGEKAELLATAEKTIAEEVIPAFARLHRFFNEEYVPGARTSLGASDMPGGEQFYAAQVRKYVTIDLTPGEIHEIGLEQVARIRSEMEDIISGLEYEGDFASFLEFLRSDPRFYAKTPKELLAHASYYAKKIDGRLPSMFGHLPRQPYGVAAVPEEIAPFFTTGRYSGAPLNAHRGGYYWVNTYELESRPLYAIPALTLHEGAPGHHTQIALSLEQQDQPPFRRYDYISAYGEGWGLYAEKLGVEMDIYESPYEHFGRLTYEMWRACRLVIDTGVHAKGWTREQAQHYLAANTALSLHEVTTEVDRYISWPGQALSYKLGEYTIWQLRHKAEQDLGEDFDIRAFHDYLLSLGSVPLDVLKDEIERWIGEQS